jgi:hypothetical protein
MADPVLSKDQELLTYLRGKIAIVENQALKAATHKSYLLKQIGLRYDLEEGKWLRAEQVPMEGDPAALKITKEVGEEQVPVDELLVKFQALPDNPQKIDRVIHHLTSELQRTQVPPLDKDDVELREYFKGLEAEAKKKGKQEQRTLEKLEPLRKKYNEVVDLLARKNNLAPEQIRDPNKTLLKGQDRQTLIRAHNRYMGRSVDAGDRLNKAGRAEADAARERRMWEYAAVVPEEIREQLRRRNAVRVILSRIAHKGLTRESIQTMIDDLRRQQEKGRVSREIEDQKDVLVRALAENFGDFYRKALVRAEQQLTETKRLAAADPEHAAQWSERLQREEGFVDDLAQKVEMADLRGEGSTRYKDYLLSIYKEAEDAIHGSLEDTKAGINNRKDMREKLDLYELKKEYLDLGDNRLLRKTWFGEGGVTGLKPPVGFREERGAQVGLDLGDLPGGGRTAGQISVVPKASGGDLQTEAGSEWVTATDPTSIADFANLRPRPSKDPSRPAPSVPGFLRTNPHVLEIKAPAEMAGVYKIVDTAPSKLKLDKPLPVTEGNVEYVLGKVMVEAPPAAGAIRMHALKPQVVPERAGMVDTKQKIEPSYYTMTDPSTPVSPWGIKAYLSNLRKTESEKLSKLKREMSVADFDELQAKTRALLRSEKQRLLQAREAAIPEGFAGAMPEHKALYELDPVIGVNLASRGKVGVDVVEHKGMYVVRDDVGQTHGEFRTPAEAQKKAEQIRSASDNVAVYPLKARRRNVDPGNALPQWRVVVNEASAPVQFTKALEQARLAADEAVGEDREKLLAQIESLEGRLAKFRGRRPIQQGAEEDRGAMFQKQVPEIDEKTSRPTGNMIWAPANPTELLRKYQDELEQIRNASRPKALAHVLSTLDWLETMYHFAQPSEKRNKDGSTETTYILKPKQQDLIRDPETSRMVREIPKPGPFDRMQLVITREPSGTVKKRRDLSGKEIVEPKTDRERIINAEITGQIGIGADTKTLTTDEAVLHTLQGYDVFLKSSKRALESENSTIDVQQMVPQGLVREGIAGTGKRSDWKKITNDFPDDQNPLSNFLLVTEYRKGGRIPAEPPTVVPEEGEGPEELKLRQRGAQKEYEAARRGELYDKYIVDTADKGPGAGSPLGRVMALGEGYDEIKKVLDTIDPRRTQISPEVSKARPKEEVIEKPMNMEVELQEPEKLPGYIKAQNVVQARVTLPAEKGQEREDRTQFDLLLYNTVGTRQGITEIWIRKGGGQWYFMTKGSTDENLRAAPKAVLSGIASRNPEFRSLQSKILTFLKPNGDAFFDPAMVGKGEMKLREEEKPPAEPMPDLAPEQVERIKRLDAAAKALRKEIARLEGEKLPTAEDIERGTKGQSPEERAKTKARLKLREVNQKAQIDELKEKLERVEGMKKRLRAVEAPIGKKPATEESSIALKEKVLDRLRERLEREPENEDLLEKVIKLEEKVKAQKGAEPTMDEGTYKVSVRLTTNRGESHILDSGIIPNPVIKEVGGEQQRQMLSRREMQELAEEKVLNRDWMSEGERSYRGWQDVPLKVDGKTGDGEPYQNLSVKVALEAIPRVRQKHLEEGRAAFVFTLPINVKTGKKLKSMPQ